MRFSLESKRVERVDVGGNRVDVGGRGLLGDCRERDNVVAVRQQIVRIGHARSGSSLRKVISPVQHDLD